MLDKFATLRSKLLNRPLKRLSIRRSSSAARTGLGLIALTLVVVGCSGGGDSDLEQPVAAGLVVGQGISQDADQPLISITVRSGSEVVLNGENSDGNRFPIDQAEWQQTDNSGFVVQLDKRTDFSRAVQVPRVVTPVTLTFELTVTNTDGDRSVTPVTINVIPVGDRNRFLEFFRSVPGEYTVVAALKPGTRTTSDVEFTISQQRLASYIDRDGSQRSRAQIGLIETRSSRWLADTTATYETTTDGINAFINPNMCFALPKIDLDDINVSFDDTNPGQGVADHQRGTVEQFVELTLEVTSGTCSNASGDVIDCADAAILHVLNTNGAAAAVTTLTGDLQKTVAVEELAASTAATDRPTVTQPESAASAEAYYAATDPFDRRLTLSDWLSNAEFLDAAGDQVADSDNVLYINNYDLGFTRNMSLRRDATTGEVFAYVVNYSALRASVLQSDVLATVAMEYGPPDQNESAPQSDWLVKFFVFVPDENGVQHRVTSLNFDGRGEKWVPGACMPCHGGELKDLEPNGNFPAFGDVDAAFLPWDLDSFLFVQADGHPKLVDPLVTEGFKVNRGYIQPEDLQQFSLASQQGAFRRMNEAVLTTLKEDEGESSRFGLVRRQIHGWYGNCAKDDGATGDCATAAESDDLPDVDYNDRAYIQAGWEEAGLSDVYFDVYARHCRICHSQAKNINQFETLADLNGPTILPIVERFLYQDGVMPNARVDMDRFWVDFHGGDTAPALRLAEALGIPPERATPPGAPIARIKGSGIQTALPRVVLADQIDSQPSVANVQNQDGVRLDGSISAFAETYTWRFTERPLTSSAQLIGADTSKPAFMIDAPGQYRVELVTSNAQGSSAPVEVMIDATPGGPKLTDATYAVTLPEATPTRPSEIILSQNMLEWFDADTAPADLTYRITSAPALGAILPGLTFTQAQVNAGQVRYVQQADLEGTTDSFTYTIDDGTLGNAIADQTFAITITVLNDEPFQGNDQDLQIAAAASATIDNTRLQWNDIESDIRFTITRPTLFGDLALDGRLLGLGSSFNQSDIDRGDLTYTHTSTALNTADSFDYDVTDGMVANGGNTFDVVIAFPTVAPELRTTTLTLPVALERRISGAVDATNIPTATFALLDQDTSNAAEFEFTLVSAPTKGRLEVRGSNARILMSGQTFTLDELDTANTADGLFYVSTLAATDGADSDSLVVSVRDATEAGTCNNPGQGSTECTLAITLIERTDGPNGQTNAASIASLLDPATARLGGAANSENSAQVPWADVMITGNADGLADGSKNLNFVDEVTGVPGEVSLQYTVLIEPVFGVLKFGDAALGTNTARIYTVGDTFTHDEVLAGSIFYENRAVSVVSDNISLRVSDGVFASDVTLMVNRNFSVNSDVGWVIDTRWTDAEADTGGVCSPPTEVPRACRDCHQSPMQTGCSAPPWIDQAVAPGAAGNTLLCGDLAAQFDDSSLPDIPTGTGRSHLGGVVIQPDSFPHDILKLWGGMNPKCP